MLRGPKQMGVFCITPGLAVTPTTGLGGPDTRLGRVTQGP